jgi:hypothetical protein
MPSKIRLYLTEGQCPGECFLDGKVIHVRDVLADREFTGKGYYVHGNYRPASIHRRGEHCRKPQSRGDVDDRQTCRMREIVGSTERKNAEGARFRQLRRIGRGKDLLE